MKKLIPFLLALLLTLPVCASAAEGLEQSIASGQRIETVVSVSNADGLPEPIRDWLTALRLEMYEQSGASGFRLLNEGAEVLSWDYAEDGDVKYIASSIVDGALAIKSDALLPTLARIAEKLGELGVIPAETASAIARVLHPSDAALPEEQEAFDPARLDCSALQALPDILSAEPVRSEPAEDDAIAAGTDAYDYVLTMTITKEQAVQVVDALISFVRTNQAELAKAQYGGSLVPASYLYLVNAKMKLASGDLLTEDVVLSCYYAENSTIPADSTSSLAFYEAMKPELVAATLQTGVMVEYTPTLFVAECSRATADGVPWYRLDYRLGESMQGWMRASSAPGQQVFMAEHRNGAVRRTLNISHELAQTADGAEEAFWQLQLEDYGATGAQTDKRYEVRKTASAEQESYVFTAAELGTVMFEAHLSRAVTAAGQSPIDKESALRIDLLDGDALVAWVEGAVMSVQSWWNEVEARLPQSFQDEPNGTPEVVTNP